MREIGPGPCRDPGRHGGSWDLPSPTDLPVYSWVAGRSLSRRSVRRPGRRRAPSAMCNERQGGIETHGQEADPLAHQALRHHQGQQVPPEGLRPRRHRRLQTGEGSRGGRARPGREHAAQAPGEALRAEQLGCAPDFSGARCRRQGRGRRTCHERRRSSRRRGVRLEGAIAGGPRSRLHVAQLQAPSRAWPHRHLRPLGTTRRS